jgi:flagellar biosynthesis protein FlhF
MRLKLFRAPSMHEAMARIRAELGAEAMILGTRRVTEGIEITAAVEPRDTSAPPTMIDPARQHALRWHGVPDALAAELGQGSLDEALQATLRFSALPLTQGAAPLLFAGPPGGGKTLTVARLTTRLVMAGQKPLVITADGQRAGATEQLAAFTRLLGLKLIVADQPPALGRAMTRRVDGSPVLIDAPGADIFDAASRDLLCALAAATSATLVLVLPAGMDVAEAEDLAAAHADSGASLLVATRLDVARRLGAVLAASHSGALALAEAGVGSGAVDGLTPMTPALLAARLMADRPPSPAPIARTRRA